MALIEDPETAGPFQFKATYDDLDLHQFVCNQYRWLDFNVLGRSFIDRRSENTHYITLSNACSIMTDT